MATHYRTIVPNGHGGGTTYRDHIVNPATREDAYAVAARTPGAYVESSPNGVTGWQDDAYDNGETVTPSPVPASAAIGVMPNAATLADGHAHTAAYSGPCTGECGV